MTWSKNGRPDGPGQETTPAPPGASAPEAACLDAALGKVARRLIPFLFLLYLFAYLDRVNVGFAAASMQRSLSFSSSVYGMGAGIFFLGYALFEIASNLLLLRVGARRWIGSLMVVWGLLSASMLLVRNRPEFYLLRLSLGVAEAGFFPGVILYLTYWFPRRERARAVARFMTATAAAGVLGGAVSALLLKLDGVLHLAGWQWLFLAEGLPSLLLGVLALFRLPESPAAAAWLSRNEQKALILSLEQERHDTGPGHLSGLREGLRSGTVWLLGFVYFCLSVSLYALSLWLPLILAGIRGLHAAGGAGEVRAGLFSTLPYLAAVLTMTAIARSSDRTEERRAHLAVSLLFAAGGYLLVAGSPGASLGMLGLVIVAVGTWGAMGPFWAVPAHLLSGEARAGGIALINSVGALGGFTGPLILGLVRERTHSFRGGLLAAAGILLCGAAGGFMLPKTGPERPV